MIHYQSAEAQVHQTASSSPEQRTVIRWVTSIIGAAEVEVGLATKEFILSQNYPNPFNPTTMIQFTLPEDGKATIRIYDVLGREVATLFDGEVKAGYYQKATFDATRFATGIYIARLHYRERQLLRKMLLVK